MLQDNVDVDFVLWLVI